MFSDAPEMTRLFQDLKRAAQAECTAMIGGESGTGKELAARAIHDESPRRAAPFRAVNCATLSPTLLESELFGHVRGAFTGAVRNKPGLFSLANKGTLLLDEVADIPLDLQGRLLRVLQEKSFLPVGATKAISVDVRVISATNRVLRREVNEGRFRADLSFRLRVVPLYLPPLRHRAGDVAALFWHFLREGATEDRRRIEGITRKAFDLLLAYPWPGNVRELHSAVEYIFVMGREPVIEVSDLPPDLRGDIAPEPLEHVDPERSGEAQTERSRIRLALARHSGHKGAAAADLGMSRTTLWRRMATYDLH